MSQKLFFISLKPAKIRFSTQSRTLYLSWRDILIMPAKMQLYQNKNKKSLAKYITRLFTVVPSSPTCEYIRTVECCIYIGKSHNCACVGIIAVDKQFIIVNKHRIQKCVNQSFPVGQFVYVQIAQTIKPKSYLILIQ